MLFYILFYFVSFLLNCLKCLIQILDDIVDVLGTEEELLDQGIKPNTIRLSIGIEKVEDLIADLDAAFKGVK